MAFGLVWFGLGGISFCVFFFFVFLFWVFWSGFCLPRSTTNSTGGVGSTASAARNFGEGFLEGVHCVSARGCTIFLEFSRAYLPGVVVPYLTL